jgi:4-amino-4-deoxy-L-arabinose transferase-like glycosyltransferase
VTADTVLRPLDLDDRYLGRVPPAGRRSRRLRAGAWLAAHRRSILVVAILIPAAAALHGWNMDQWPGVTFNDDEGTYVAQAWAVQNWHTFGHYTYWYDHPPLGWTQMAGWTWLTRAWDRAPFTLAAGREAMLVAGVAATSLLYVLGRRLGFPRWAAVAAVVIFVASPLALRFHRFVWLDNIGTAWLLAALVLAASPRRSMSSAAGSAACFAVAVLSKETILVLAPVVVALLWQHTDRRNRNYRLGLFTALTGALLLSYPLYAALKNELFEGPGHVSLWWAVKWQLFSRGSNGSVFQPGSGAHFFFHTWYALDPLLFWTSGLLLPAALAFRSLRLVAFGLGLQVAMMLRPGGYLPAAYVVGMLPFAALVIAGVAGELVRAAHQVTRRWVSVPLRVGVSCAAAILTGVAVVSWSPLLRDATTTGGPVPVQQAVAWAQKHIGHGHPIIVDDNIWLDFVRAGYDPTGKTPEVVWFYKLDSDPAVRYPHGWHDLDYWVYAMDPVSNLQDRPIITEAYRRSHVIASFGTGDNQIHIRKIDH